MTVRRNLLRERLASGEPTLGTHLFLPEPAVVEAVGHTGVYDYVEFLAEYNAFTLHDFDALARAAQLMELGSLVKLDRELGRYLAQRAVGSGFDGVLFADPHHPEDVAYAVASVRPDTPDYDGSYGVSARRNVRPSYGGSPDFIQSIADTVVGIMIEVPTIFDSLAEVLSNPGIDFVQWGPADFSLRSGLHPIEDANRIADYERQLIGMCEAQGVPYRIEVHNVEDMRRYAARGARHFSIGYDLGILHDTFKRLGDDARVILEEIR